jgi:catechol 2,3-dioxygenase-like lactoylglutathione lyase family enzyme
VSDQQGQLRIVVHTDTYDQALTFLRDVLGMETVLQYENPDDDRVTILDAGRATLEIATTAHARAIDAIEGSSTPAPQFRLAVEADDTAAVTDALVSAGAVPLAPPTRTPWGSVNARVQLADGVQLTVFQQLDPGPESGPEQAGDAR